jgi:hypothetical protein
MKRQMENQNSKNRGRNNRIKNMRLPQAEKRTGGNSKTEKRVEIKQTNMQLQKGGQIFAGQNDSEPVGKRANEKRKNPTHTENLTEVRNT